MQVDIDVYENGVLVAAMKATSDGGPESMVLAEFDQQAAAQLLFSALSELLRSAQERSLDQFRGVAGPYQGPSAGGAGMS